MNPSLIIYSASTKIIKSIYFWLVAWAILFSVYFTCLQFNALSVIANNIAYYSQIFFDLAVGLSCFFAYKVATEKTVKYFLQLSFISICIGLYSDEMYNFIFHFVSAHYGNLISNLLWIVPYTVFLIIQIIAWAYLIKSNEKKVHPIMETWFTTLCFIQAPIIVCIAALLVSFFKATPISVYGFVQNINTILEIFLFFIVSIALSRSKNKWLSCLAAGILLLISFNMTHRFSYSGGYFNKTFDVAWLICFVFISFGFIYFIGGEEKTVKFHDQKSIYVLISALFSLLTSILFFVFALLEIFISNFVESNALPSFENFLINVPGILIFSFMTSIFVAKIVSSYALHSIENIFHRVSLMKHNELDVIHFENQKYQISEIQKLDDFILHTLKKLYDANQAKSHFLMNMSHDFRTPVSGIHSMSKFIYEKISDEKTKALQKLVVDSSDQLMEIIDQILGYYQLLRDEKNLSFEKIDMGKLIDGIVTFMSAKSREKNLDVYVQYSNPAIFYTGDYVMLHRMLLNIFSNAIKFTENGYVKITMHEHSTEGKNNVAIKIEDTGIGIDHSHFDSIFEPFYQIESSCTSQYHGIGLGLSHVKLIVEKLNGKINVYSALGVGSTFEIILPM